MVIPSFIAESNKIEGIVRTPTVDELTAHDRFLELDVIHVADMEAFVTLIQPDAILRRRKGLNVRVGNHIAPPGGPAIEKQLNDLLDRALDTTGQQPFEIHQWYETLHPFTDGNGRSGRALWLWMMQRRGEIERALALGFLHAWYYQSLDAVR